MRWIMGMLVVPWASLSAAEPFRFTLQSQQPIKELQPNAPSKFRIVHQPLEWDPAKTAVIVCDVWDLHHSLNAVRRLEEFCPRLNTFLKAARDRGAVIIHAPSDCMAAYEAHPARQRAIESPRAADLPPLAPFWCSQIPAEERADYPIDQSDGGDDDDPTEHAEWAKKLAARGRVVGTPWLKQSPLIDIDADQDYISDRGDEIWNILRQRGIEQVVLTGVHVNMCVLGRPFGLRQMVRHGMPVVLVRDLTDAMYNPACWPYVDHFTGTDLVIRHIERYVCPTITSDQLLGGEPFRSKHDPRQPGAVLDTLSTHPATAETYWKHWTTTNAPLVLEEATGGVVRLSNGPVWLRATVRIPREAIADSGLFVRYGAEERSMGVPRVWWNGSEVFPPEGEGDGNRLIPAAALLPDDINLLVIRLDGVPGATKAHRDTELVELVSGDRTWRLDGRWQFRLGDGDGWSNMPLPAKFGAGSDILHDLTANSGAVKKTRPDR